MTTLKFSLHGQSFHVHRKTFCNQSSLFSWIRTLCGTSRLAQLSPLTNSVKAISSTRYILNSTYWASWVFCCLQSTRKLSLINRSLDQTEFPFTNNRSCSITTAAASGESKSGVFLTQHWCTDSSLVWQCCGTVLFMRLSLQLIADLGKQSFTPQEKTSKTSSQCHAGMYRDNNSDAIQTAILQGMIMARTRNALWCALANLVASTRNANPCQNWIKPVHITKQTDSSVMSWQRNHAKIEVTFFSAHVSICFHKVTKKMLFHWPLWMPICTDVTEM